ncbi:sodium-dependent glucose transporter 1A-like [Patella vulgata]|uniref:sodium-dependent glucose transporter 1A-like n=1 Tax=Patella vulgata TaxID=6465 RepID=UPI0024A9E461|nr:sodium-dependent glucose transporter 1A-like [Patella vulgata]
MDKEAAIQNGALLESPVSAGGEITNGETKRKSVRESLRHAAYRSKFIQSISVSFAFWCLGFQGGQRGPSFLDIQLITNTNVEKASTFFTAASVGYLSGSLISGILYDRFNKTLLLGLCVILMAITVAVLPLCSPYGLMLVIFWSNSFFMGGLDAGGNAHLVSIWGEDEGRPYMQAAHFAFAFGGVISPLVTAPFLVPNTEETSTNSSSTTFTEVTTMPSTVVLNTTLLDYNITNDNSTLGNNITTIAEPVETKLIYAYIISGIVTLLSAIPFMVIYCRYKSQKIKRNEPKKDENRPIRDLPWKYYILAIVLLNVFYVAYCVVENSFAAYLMTFVVMELKWSKAKGTQITSAFWAAFAVSRFSGIFIIRCLRPVVMLFICIAGLIISFSGFLLCSHYKIHTGVWICTVLVGFSMSVVFPTGFTWGHENLLNITGKVASLILVAASAGTVINPVIIGYLMEELTPMWYCYLLVGESILCLAIFVVLLFVAKFVLVHKRIITTTTIEVGSPQAESINNGTHFIPNIISSEL